MTLTKDNTNRNDMGFLLEIMQAGMKKSMFFKC